MSNARKLADNLPTEGSLSGRNVVVNGEFVVSQRGTSFNQPADGAYTLDRFAVYRNGAGIVDVDQTTTVPTGQGFKNSLKCTVDTADSSLASSDFGGFLTKIEGQDLKRFEFGNSSAKKFALSFWARSSITGTYSVAFRNGAANRYLVKEYTISSADTWQHITITDTADVTGTWTTGATTGLDLRWCLWEGGFSAAADTWGAGNIVGSSSNVNWAASAGNTFYITGVQLEVGDTATDFEHRTFGDELQRCQRYTFVHETGVAYGWSALSGYCNTTSNALAFYQFPVKMRAAPSLTVSGNFQILDGFTSYSVTSNTLGMGTVFNARVDVGASGLTAGRHIATRNNNDADAKVIFDAEL